MCTGGGEKRQSHLTARMRVFTAGMMSSKVRSQWELFSSPLSSGGQSAVGGWVRGRGVAESEDCPLVPPSMTSQPDPDPTSPWGLPSTGVRALSRKDARKRVLSLKLQLFCTLVRLEASGMSSVLGERCRGSPSCCLPRLPCRCELLSRMRSLMPILLLHGRAGWAASEVRGHWGDGDGDREGSRSPLRAHTWHPLRWG